MNILSAYMGHHNRGCWNRLRRSVIHLANQGHMLHLVIARDGYEVKHPNVRIYRTTPWLRNGSLQDLFFVVLAPLVSIYIFVSSKVTFLFAFDAHNAFFIAPVRLLSSNTPLSLFVRTNPAFDNSGSVMGKIRSVIGRIGYRLASQVIYASRTSAQQIENFYKRENGHFAVLYNNASISKALTTGKQERRSRTGFQEEAFIVGYCGQFIGRKNLSYLLEAFAHMKTSRPKWLLLKGSGPLKQTLEREAKSLGIHRQVVFLPWGDNTSNFYRDLDVFVLPSIYDDCSNALLEAMAHGVCSLASNVGGNLEVLNWNESQLFPLGDGAQALKANLDMLADNPDMLEKFRKDTVNAAQLLCFDWGRAFENVLLNTCEIDKQDNTCLPKYGKHSRLDRPHA